MSQAQVALLREYPPTIHITPKYFPILSNINDLSLLFASIDDVNINSLKTIIVNIKNHDGILFT